MAHTKSFPVRGQSSAVTHRMAPPSGRVRALAWLVHGLQAATDSTARARRKDVQRLTGSSYQQPSPFGNS